MLQPDCKSSSGLGKATVSSKRRDGEGRSERGNHATLTRLENSEGGKQTRSYGSIVRQIETGKLD